MTTESEPHFADGKICYIEIPCAEPAAASAFYATVFGWQLRQRADGSVAFDDGVGEVSGTWVTGRPPSGEAGVVIHVMVGEIDPALARVRSAGGHVVREVDPAHSEVFAHIQDPFGNLFGVYEQAGLAEEVKQAASAAHETAGAAVPPVPERRTTVTARLAVPDAIAALDFYAAAFGAEEIGERFCASDGTLIHAELRIGDAVVMVTDDDGYRALLATYWTDVDAAWERAIGAGAAVVFPLADQFYGERGGRLQDPFGQQWMLSAQIEILSAEEMRARAGG